MAEDLTLSDHHSEMIGNYLKFAKFRRGKHVRTIDQTFDDLKQSRLLEGTYTADEVKEMFDELCALLKGDLEIELIDTAHTAALLLFQMCVQAQQWHLKLNADISELENRDLLEKPLAENVGATQLLQAEIDRTLEILETKSMLAETLAEAQRELKDLKEGKAEDVEKDLKHLEDEMFQTMCASAYTQQHLECDLVETKQQLLEVQAQLQLAENFQKYEKQILATKNEQIKNLRLQLNKNEED
ncbi:leucine zipper transcription factor-like protein 1 [Caerostris extrusa]|uniref:Leucine zipper transcription factor-like protein 1 n=1 Tax=Caerostris extrusa TaxID=172846 RepID=A0AAV4RFI3_CAEEX|nr:leucine zipper transcription factor-like protein 1 [Caerostris extrusa]